MSEHDTDGERSRLAELYAEMADGELQLLGRDFASLSPRAQDALQSEFRRRDLTPEGDLYAPDPGQDVLEWDDLVVLQQYRDLPQALLAKGSLESAGVDVVLVDDNMVRMDWFISNLVGGVKLCVRQQDEEAALELLAQPPPASIYVDGAGRFYQPSCPQCNSLNIAFEALNRPVAYGSAWLGVPIPLKRERWKCDQCGHHWVDTANSATSGQEDT
jgi:hypothetical protein